MEVIVLIYAVLDLNLNPRNGIGVSDVIVPQEEHFNMIKKNKKHYLNGN